MTVQFTVPGQPVGKGRPIVGMGFHGRPTLRTPVKTVNYEGLVAHAAQAAMAGRPLLEGAVCVDLLFWFTVPASWSLKKQRMALAGEIYPTLKPDSDNIIKAVCDACNGVVWRDDVQCVDGSWRKRYGPVPGVVVTITPLVHVEQVALDLPKAAVAQDDWVAA